ncbi:uncharacterized protein L201_002035 [Kwoniella dendrophila CBS 6074]|uniref:Gfd2/YDR514C-like C-terminal domain-containing protein n=1 Tax=Kwoniella dendrophila CBS 6074 TaxID=1295534 RepID=A0AAX4JP69_9TREE
MALEKIQGKEVEPVPRTLAKEDLELVTDGYYRHNDIVFRYTEALSELHANAMGNLINGNALIQPDHPLRSPGDDGITLYIGTDKLGKPRLLFSIKQISYLQYYIHQMRLTTPSWIEYHSKRAELLEEEDGEAKVANLLQPSLEEGKDDWVPLPSYPIKASDLVSIIPITVNSNVTLKALSKQLMKDGKEVDRHIRNGLPVPEYDPHRWEAVKDNNTPGPGLRKGPEREGRSDAARNESAEGTGWGGFPLKKDEVDQNKTSSDPTDSIATQNITNPEIPSSAKGADLSPSSSRSGSSTPFNDLGASYHYHCQQAFLIAISGGMAGYLSESQKSASGADDEEEGYEDFPPEVGRSLFIALSVTRWEKDPSVILEIGWSAIWWQRSLPVSDGIRNTDEKVEYEEMRDEGHYIVQDHLLHKRNGDKRPDYRDDYLFGDSLQVEASKIRPVLKQKLKDLSAKAGNGPIYVVTHTPEGEELNFKDIGLDISLTAPDLQPDGWDVPPYMCAAGCNSVFVINTASFFGSIENVPSVQVDTVQQAGRSKKSLQHTALVMFGNDSARRPEKCGNAGNDAMYTLAIFVEIMTGLTLPELRADYSNVQTPIKGLSLNHEENESDAKVVRTVPLTPISQVEEPSQLTSGQGKYEERDMIPDVDEDEEGGSDFMEDDMITGVYYEDDDGNMVEMSD